jgi:uncharacterized protein YbjT (DUF2867 family)
LSPQWIDDAGLVRELKSADVSRVALLSSSAAPTGDLSNAVAADHIRSEQALEQSGIAAAFLRPNSFMSNALRWLPQIGLDDPGAIRRRRRRHERSARRRRCRRRRGGRSRAPAAGRVSVVVLWPWWS